MVERMKSKCPARLLRPLESRVLTKWCAPRAMASASLCGGGRKGGDFGAKGTGKLERHVAQSADADDADARAGVHAVVAHRVVDGDAAAEQRGGVFAFQRRRNRDREARVAPGPRRHIRRCGARRCPGLCAQRFSTTFTAPFAVPAGVGLPAHADPFADRQIGDRRSRPRRRCR